MTASPKTHYGKYFCRMLARTFIFCIDRKIPCAMAIESCIAGPDLLQTYISEAAFSPCSRRDFLTARMHMHCLRSLNAGTEKFSFVLMTPCR
jgi:hypothetical protein